MKRTVDTPLLSRTEMAEQAALSAANCMRSLSALDPQQAEHELMKAQVWSLIAIRWQLAAITEELAKQAGRP